MKKIIKSISRKATFCTILGFSMFPVLACADDGTNLQTWIGGLLGGWGQVKMVGFGVLALVGVLSFCLGGYHIGMQTMFRKTTGSTMGRASAMILVGVILASSSGIYLKAAATAGATDAEANQTSDTYSGFN